MDLLGDIGTADQLTAARSENKILQERVKQLTQRVKILTVENETLKAEVEIYRKEAAVPNFSNLALGQSASNDASMQVEDANVFVQSGNGVHPKENVVTLRLHDISNPLCCALSTDDTIVCSGGADASMRLVAWGAALDQPVETVVQKSCRLQVSAPVVCVGFSPVLRNIVASGCMDGSLHLAYYSLTGGGIQAQLQSVSADWSHKKYVRGLAWSPMQPILATSSADGTIQIFRVEHLPLAELNPVKVSKLTSLHLEGTIESLCFVQNQLVAYARGTPYLSYFDVEKDFCQRKVNLNQGQTGSSGFDDHVSFAVLDLQPSPNQEYLALATDASRNIILEVDSGRVVRNLYGHHNDLYSHPKVAWSRNGQYVFGNTQDDSCLCVWDVSSGNIVQRLTGHTSPIRDIDSSVSTDTVVTTAWDKTTRLWMVPTSDSDME